jgi:hypothetical protein
MRRCAVIGKTRSGKASSMRIRPLVWKSFALAFVLLAFTATAASATATVGLPATNDDVKFGVDVGERGTSVSQGIPIETTKGNAPERPVYAVPIAFPGQPSVAQIAASVYTSYCWKPDITGAGGAFNGPCQTLPNPNNNPNYPTSYTPGLKLTIYRATDPNNVSTDAGSTVLNSNDNYACPYDQHHCPLTLKYTGSIQGAGGYIVVSVKAWDANARAPDLLELEGDCAQTAASGDQGDYNPGGAGSPSPFCAPTPANDSEYQTGAGGDTRGQLTVTRYLGPYSGTNPMTTANAANKATQIPITTSSFNEAPVVIFQTPVSGLQPDDVLEVDAQMSAKNDGTANTGTIDTTSGASPYVFEHDVATWWMLSTTPLVTHVKPSTALASTERWVSAANGKNCENDTNGCPIHQAGAVIVPDGVTPAQTLYLNYVAEATDNQAKPKKAGVSAHVYAKVLGSQPITFNASCLASPRAIPAFCGGW